MSQLSVWFDLMSQELIKFKIVHLLPNYFGLTFFLIGLDTVENDIHHGRLFLDKISSALSKINDMASVAHFRSGLCQLEVTLENCTSMWKMKIL